MKRNRKPRIRDRDGLETRPSPNLCSACGPRGGRGGRPAVCVLMASENQIHISDVRARRYNRKE